jgi:hypothetical protein
MKLQNEIPCRLLLRAENTKLPNELPPLGLTQPFRDGALNACSMLLVSLPTKERAR